MPFSNTPWETPESNLSPEDFCSVCLIDENEPRQQKIKANCKLPIRSTPGGPYSMAAMRNAAARLPQTDAPTDAKRKAARRLVSLMREAGMEPGESTMRMAGMR